MKNVKSLFDFEISEKSKSKIGNLISEFLGGKSFDSEKFSDLEFYEIKAKEKNSKSSIRLGGLSTNNLDSVIEYVKIKCKNIIFVEYEILNGKIEIYKISIFLKLKNDLFDSEIRKKIKVEIRNDSKVKNQINIRIYRNHINEFFEKITEIEK